MKREASVLAGSVFLVIVDSLLLMTHRIVLPSRGALTDTLNLTISLTRFGPAFAITLLSSSLTSVMALLLSVTEFLRTLEPWLELLMFLITALTALGRRWSALRAQSLSVIV
jgi:hypothetical protein